MKIQYLGQNCFLFTYKEKTILCDPFITIKKLNQDSIFRLRKSIIF
ncbi:MBL fold metallo-hydrolase [Chryseobacterium indoltheticum]